jgi:AraC-like DNA-binding protein
MNHKILYAALMVIFENEQQFNIESIANYLGCSSREVAFGFDTLSDMGAIKWSLDFDNNLSIELLADLEIV